MKNRFGRYISVLLMAAVWTAVCLAPAAASPLQATDRTYKDGKQTVTYPYFTGIKNSAAAARINRTLKEAADDFIEKNKADDALVEAIMKYKLHYRDDNVLSLEIVTYQYAGGAHGMSYLRGYTFDLQTGEPYALTRLFDFRPSEINAAIADYARKNEGMSFYLTDFKGIEAYPTQFYLIGKDQPALVFQQYEIAPYAAGIIRVPMGTRERADYSRAG